MMNMLKSTIVSTIIQRPWPFPRRKIEIEDILVIALLYIVMLILIKGLGIIITIAQLLNTTRVQEQSQ